MKSQEGFKKFFAVMRKVQRGNKKCRLKGVALNLKRRKKENVLFQLFESDISDADRFSGLDIARPDAQKGIFASCGNFEVNFALLPLGRIADLGGKVFAADFYTGKCHHGTAVQKFEGKTILFFRFEGNCCSVKHICLLTGAD